MEIDRFVRFEGVSSGVEVECLLGFPGVELLETGLTSTGRASRSGAVGSTV